MLFRVIDKTELPELLNGFLVAHQVIGPVDKGDHFEFAPVTAADELALDYTLTTLPPKKYLLPPRETLLSFGTTHAEDIEVVCEVTPRVIFGVHACDINAINRLDAVFLGDEFPDPYYRARREATLVVGISCTPFAECLCGLWGTGEVHSGYDLFLFDLGEVYLVSIYSVEGANILEATCHPRPATPAEVLDFEICSKRFHDSFAALPDTAELPMLMDVLHKDATWDELGERCLSCTACSVSCPTCYCFDLIDLTDPDGCGGRRQRVWDSCNSPGFAVVAGGHNFRDSGRNRVRHRFYHKLLSFRAKYGDMLCVGCGRCVRSCKADINPRTVIERLYRDRDRWLTEQGSGATGAEAAAAPAIKAEAAPATPPASVAEQGSGA
ncbi:MAG: 4Fe-4S dicluster domain-containing protein [Coriobacteriales bacterium]|jgi:ferredoxin|nr:4Fe-4S dicluster domain-containing protein [Coriobacteriales bacterium]